MFKRNKAIFLRRLVVHLRGLHRRHTWRNLAIRYEISESRASQITEKMAREIGLGQRWESRPERAARVVRLMLASGALDSRDSLREWAWNNTHFRLWR